MENLLAKTRTCVHAKGVAYWEVIDLPDVAPVLALVDVQGNYKITLSRNTIVLSCFDCYNATIELPQQTPAT